MSPSSQSVTVAGVNVTSVNFSATSVQYSISGVIAGGPGSTVTLTGASTMTTVADGSGNYSFTGLAVGSYLVTPAKTGLVFSPASTSVTVYSANLSMNFTVPSNCPCDTIWQPSASPSTLDSNDPNATELGVTFRADADGYITGIRFYKGAANTGTHVGNLWSSTGTLLGTATFVNESATGWQQVLFSSPVPVKANTSYGSFVLCTAGPLFRRSAVLRCERPRCGTPACIAGRCERIERLVHLLATSAFPTSTYGSANY